MDVQCSVAAAVQMRPFGDVSFGFRRVRGKIVRQWQLSDVVIQDVMQRAPVRPWECAYLRRGQFGRESLQQPAVYSTLCPIVGRSVQLGAQFRKPFVVPAVASVAASIRVQTRDFVLYGARTRHPRPIDVEQIALVRARQLRA